MMTTKIKHQITKEPNHTQVKNSHGDTAGIVTQNTKKAEGIVER